MGGVAVGGGGVSGGFAAWVEELIPHGGDRAHLVGPRTEEGGAKHPWESYPDRLGGRGLKKTAGTAES